MAPSAPSFPPRDLSSYGINSTALSVDERPELPEGGVPNGSTDSPSCTHARQFQSRLLFDFAFGLAFQFNRRFECSGRA